MLRLLALAILTTLAHALGGASAFELDSQFYRDEIYVETPLTLVESNVVAFVTAHDMLAVGSLELTVPEFVDAEKKQLYTRVVLKPREILRGPQGLERADHPSVRASA